MGFTPRDIMDLKLAMKVLDGRLCKMVSETSASELIQLPFVDDKGGNNLTNFVEFWKVNPDNTRVLLFSLDHYGNDYTATGTKKLASEFINPGKTQYNHLEVSGVGGVWNAGIQTFTFIVDVVSVGDTNNPPVLIDSDGTQLPLLAGRSRSVDVIPGSITFENYGTVGVQTNHAGDILHIQWLNLVK